MGKIFVLGCQKFQNIFFRVSKNSFFFLFTDGKVQILKGNFSPNDVHHQFGIALTTPAFPHFNVTSRVEAQMYLHKKSDGITSIPVPFYFCPNEDQKKPIITATRSQTKGTEMLSRWRMWCRNHQQVELLY